MIDQVTIDRILDAAQIMDVVSDFVTLRKRGVNYVGLCPFHSDKTPSFYVSPAKGLCKCFACGKGGNAVHFIMEHEQMSYPEALKYLAKKYNIRTMTHLAHFRGKYQFAVANVLTADLAGFFAV
jgi:DNA primase